VADTQRQSRFVAEGLEGVSLEEARRFEEFRRKKREEEARKKAEEGPPPNDE